MPRATTEARSVANGPTIASTREYWTLHLKSQGRAERTISTYLNALRKLDEFLAEQGMPRQLRAIRREHLEAWIADMLGRNQAGTVSIAFRSVRPFFRWLVDEDEIDRSPMDKMKTPTPPQNPPAVLRADDIGLLLAVCKGPDFISRRDLAILSLMLDTGIRRGELAGMTVGDLNLSQMVAFVEATTSKSRRGRAVAFGPSTAKAITRYLRHPKAPHAPQDALWRARTGLPLTGNEIYHTVRRRAEQAGIRVHPHQLRHTWASHMLGAGHSEGDVMALGGWASRDMLSRYGASAASERAIAAYRSPIESLKVRR
ncbi:MAG: tyrosine-type recombinase/integrase [Chloroflexota bacterium]|nr:tyrosine-type recombinase/integrase [Chloroflexota bacterium]